MEDMFFKRTAIDFQKMMVIASALSRPENHENMAKAVKRLGAMMFPRDEVAEEQRDEAMRETLRVEGQKSYKVERLFGGERRS